MCGRVTAVEYKWHMYIETQRVKCVRRDDGTTNRKDLLCEMYKEHVRYRSRLRGTENLKVSPSMLDAN